MTDVVVLQVPAPVVVSMKYHIALEEAKKRLALTPNYVNALTVQKAKREAKEKALEARKQIKEVK